MMLIKLAFLFHSPGMYQKVASCVLKRYPNPGYSEWRIISVPSKGKNYFFCIQTSSWKAGKLLITSEARHCVFD